MQSLEHFCKFPIILENMLELKVNILSHSKVDIANEENKYCVEVNTHKDEAFVSQNHQTPEPKSVFIISKSIQALLANLMNLSYTHPRQINIPYPFKTFIFSFPCKVQDNKEDCCDSKHCDNCTNPIHKHVMKFLQALFPNRNPFWSPRLKSRNNICVQRSRSN